MTLKSCGYCFVTFRKSSQAEDAITAMNGFKFKGKILKVGIANEGNKYAADNGDLDEDHIQNLQNKQALMQKLSREPVSAMTMGLPQSLPMTTPQGNYQSSEVVHSSCLLLGNLFDPTQVNINEDGNFYIETKQDVFEECLSFGKVEDVWVDKNSQGNVWVKFAQNNWQAARAAFEQLNGR